MMSIGEGIRKITEYLFPVFCLSCSGEGAWLCDTCRPMLAISAQYFCPVCHASTDHGAVCASCREKSYLTAHVAATKYEEDGLIGLILHTFKYQYAEDIFCVIDKILAEFLEREKEMYRGVDIVVPVPLHKKRFAERGFNQAAAIGSSLARYAGIPFADRLLERVRDTPHQATLDRAGRLENVAEAFQLKDPVRIQGVSVLLVDDVLTTGSTLQECARALHAGGAGKISAFTLARG